jgi:hypothetical protein
MEARLLLVVVFSCCFSLFLSWWDLWLHRVRDVSSCNAASAGRRVFWATGWTFSKTKLGVMVSFLLPFIPFVLFVSFVCCLYMCYCIPVRGRLTSSAKLPILYGENVLSLCIKTLWPAESLGNMLASCGCDGDVYVVPHLYMRMDAVFQLRESWSGLPVARPTPGQAMGAHGQTS